MRATKPLRERFDQKWEAEADSGCWLWIGMSDVNGYTESGDPVEAGE